MPRRGSREVVTRNVYKDKTGFSVIVRINGKPKEHRFPVGTPLSVLIQQRGILEKDKEKREGTGRTSLVRSKQDYLDAKEGELTKESLQAATSELDAWILVLGGATPRHEIDQKAVKRARTTWKAAGKSHKTINNRVDRLRQVYRTLDGKTAWTPCDGLDPLPVSRTPIERITPETINAVLKKLTDPKARARFMVYASTGRRPSEIMRTKRSDVDLDARVWVPRDGKGGFTPGIYLNDEMLIAWKAMIDADALGSFNMNSFVPMLHRAGWPKHIRPYQLRHNVGIALSELGHDLADVGPQMGHKRAETTRRHYVPVLNSRMQRLSESLEGRFGWSDGTNAGTKTEAT
jgi:integrase